MGSGQPAQHGQRCPESAGRMRPAQMAQARWCQAIRGGSDEKVVEQVAWSARLEPKRAMHKLTSLDRRDVAARRPARAPAYPAWMQPQRPGRSGRVLSGYPQSDCQRLLECTLVLNMPCHCWRLSAEPGGPDSIGKPHVTGVCDSWPVGPSTGLKAVQPSGGAVT